MRRDNIDLPPRVVTDSYLKTCDSAEEVRAVLKKQRTLKMTGRDIRKKRISKLLAKYKKQRPNLSKLFKRHKTVVQHKESIAMLFTENVLKKFDDPILFYSCPIRPEFKGWRVRMAHFDGRYKGAPRGFTQSVELRLVLTDEKSEVTVTFARALLKSSKIEAYEHFFRLVRNAHCPKINNMMTDFEMAISQAALNVFTRLNIRGCWYHFFNNLYRMTGRLQRLTAQTACPKLFRLLSVMPFLYNWDHVVHYLLMLYDYEEQDTCFKSVNTKLILYVYQIYCLRYRRMFFIDLKRDPRRTNNSAEGSNSGLARMKSYRMTLREFADYCEVMWKRDLHSKPRKIKAVTNVDDFLLSIQKVSKYNVTDLVDFLLDTPVVQSYKIEYMVRELPSFTRKTRVNDDEHCKLIADSMGVIVSRYKQFRAEKRAAWRQYRQIANDGIVVAEPTDDEQRYEGRDDEEEQFEWPRHRNGSDIFGFSEVNSSYSGSEMETVRKTNERASKANSTKVSAKRLRPTNSVRKSAAGLTRRP